MMKLKLLKINKVYFSFLIIALLLAFIWFKDGKILATAEEGMTFYDLSRSAKLYSSIWWESIAPGSVISVSQMSAPYLWLFRIVNLLFSNATTQGIFFAILFFSGLSGMYLLTSDLVKNKWISFISVLFYLFNLYTLSQVFFRALNARFFLWVYFPLFIFLYLNWIKKGKKLVFILISSLVFVPAFSHPGYLIAFILISALVFVYFFLKEKAQRRVIFSRALILFILMLAIHIWWIYPMFIFSKDTFGSGSIVTNSQYLELEAVSKSFPLEEILLLRERYYFTNWFGGWYKAGLSVLPSVMILLLVIYGLVKGRKLKTWGLLSFVLVIGLFAVKGANPPLGSVFYRILFKFLPFTTVLRNPYEKLGLIYLIPYSIFFGLGIYYFCKKHKSKYIKLAIISIMFLFNWPYWKNGVYPDFALVKIPGYYSQVDEILNSDQSDSRVLVLPQVPDHSAVFAWGYRGVEPSRFLFDRPTIAVGGGVSDSKHKEMLLAIKNAEDIGSYLKLFNINSVVLRHDLDTQVSVTTSILDTQKALTNTKGLTNIGKYGELEVFKYEAGGNGLFELRGDPSAKISYLKYNQRDYTVLLEGIKNPATLVFKQNFNKNWEARLNDINLDKHFMEYGYANAWEIPMGDRYILEVKFKIWPWE